MKILQQRRLLFRSQWKLSILVVGLFSLFRLGNGAWAQNYVEVFSDDFTGSDLGDWQPNPNYTISDGQVVSSFGEWYKNQPLLRPTSENQHNGKVEFTAERNPNFILRLVARYHITQNGSGSYYAVEVQNSQDTVRIMKVEPSYQNEYGRSIAIFTGVGIANIATTDTEKVEFAVESINYDTTQLRVVIYNSGGNVVFSGSTIDSDPELQTSGQWGLYAINQAKFEDFSLYKSNLSIIADRDNIKVGTPIFYTVYGSENQTITFSSDKEGIFSQTDVELNTGNAYTATIIYTPHFAGSGTITAISTNGETKTHSIFALPYATTIGYIGDSITMGALGTPLKAAEVASSLLGYGFNANNQGANGSTTWSRTDGQLFTPAMQSFVASGVEIVSIMLGTNDSRIDDSTTIEIYKTRMQTLISNLKANGVKKIILNEPPYVVSGAYNNASRGEGSHTKLLGFIDVLDEISDGEMVIRGDTQVYEYFEANQIELTGNLSDGNPGDGLHPNMTGHQHLGEFRATAIKSVIAYQINPDHHFTGGSNHTLGTSGSLTFRVDKYFGEFSDVVKVDASPLASSEYEATSGSTTIELTADYLNTLSVGSHTLSVGFEGGVWVEEDFTIFPDPTIVPPTPSQPSQPASPSYSGGGGGGASLSKDSCPSGDFSTSYYDKTCGTTADLADEVAKKVNVLRPLIVRIFLTATDAQKALVHDIITSCSQTNKKEVIKLACQKLVEKWDF